MAMTKGEARKITKERLERWTNRLAGETATPVFLMGVRHDKANSGQPVLLMTEDISNEQVASFLLAAAKVLLENQPPQQHGRWEMDVK